MLKPVVGAVRAVDVSVNTPRTKGLVLAEIADWIKLMPKNSSGICYFNLQTSASGMAFPSIAKAPPHIVE
jgi:hypothetical protein